MIIIYLSFFINCKKTYSIFQPILFSTQQTNLFTHLNPLDLKSQNSTTIIVGQHLLKGSMKAGGDAMAVFTSSVFIVSMVVTLEVPPAAAGVGLAACWAFLPMQDWIKQLFKWYNAFWFPVHKTWKCLRCSFILYCLFYICCQFILFLIVTYTLYLLSVLHKPIFPDVLRVSSIFSV